MGHGSRVVKCRAFGRRDRGSKPPLPFQSLGNFIYPTLPVSFGGDSKSMSREYILCIPSHKRTCCVFHILGVNVVDSISRKCCGLLLSFVSVVDYW